MLGQSGPQDVAVVLGSPEVVSLYQCFPSCSVPDPPLPPPPVPFSGRVVESSSPHLGTGFNGGVPSATITMTGDRNGTTTFSTNSSGDYSSEYYPESTPTLTAEKWGLSTTGSPGSTMTLYTDATTKLGLGPDSAPAADGATWTVTGNPNGSGTDSLSRALFMSPSLPALIKIPRNGSTDSSLTVTAADSPRFTWAGEPALALSQTVKTGSIASGTMRFNAIHKWIKVNVDVKELSGVSPTEDTSDLQISVYAYENDGGGKPVYSTRFGLPTVTTASSTIEQSNPAPKGVFNFYVPTVNRLSTPSAPYHPRFRVKLENGFYVSYGSNDNETFTITDAMRKSGTANMTVKLVFKAGQK